MHKQIILLGFIFFSSFMVVASTCTVTGVIQDEKKNSLPFANVILINAPDSSIIKAELSNEAGNYKFVDVVEGRYRILIAQLGYAKYYSQAFEVTGSSSSVNVNTISLETASVNLSEANVSALKPLIEHRIDRTIVNVENSIVNAGATVLEILKRSPGVTVDNEGNISLAGKQGVLIMMDGKPTYLSQRDLFELIKNMSSDQLSLIEIITNPSAKYDAAGTSGIINFKLRKKQNTGFNGRAQISYGQGKYPDIGGGFSLNYGSEKYNVFGGYDYFNGYYFEEVNLLREFKESGYNSSFKQHSYDKGQYINNSFRGGADFFLSKKNSLGFILRGNQYVNHDKTTSATDIYNQTAISDSGYVTYNTSESEWANISGTLNYNYKIDSVGRELSADVDLAHYSNHNDFHFETNHYFTGSDYSYTDIATDNQPAIIDIRSFKIDYTHPFQKTMKLEAGAKSSYVTTDNEVKYYNYYNDVAVLDTGKTNHFIYNENINAGYINWSGEFGKIGLQGGLRVEQTISEGKQLVSNSNFNRNYIEFFPSTFFNYKFSEKHMVNASYSRRIDRPEYQQLNPFKYFIDPYNYMEGNPLLQPQLTNSFELSYTFLQMFTFALKYSHTEDAMTQITKQIDSTHTTFVTTENLDSYDNYGIRLSIPFNITDWLQSSNEFNLFNNSYSGMASVGQVDKSLTSYTFNSSNSITLPKGFSAEVNFWYNSQMVWGTWLVDPQYSLSGGFGKMFLNDRIQLRINLNDVLHTEITKSKIEYQNINADFKRVFDSQFFRIHLSYKFGKQMQRKRSIRAGSEEEQNRVRQGR